MPTVELSEADKPIVKALRHVYNVIGTDLGWDEQLPSKATIREVVQDSMHPRVTYGAAPDAVASFCRMPADERARLLRLAIP